MRRTLVLAAAVVTLAVPAAARAVAIPENATQTGAGVLGNGVRYVALGAGSRTLLQAIRVRDGVVLRSSYVDGVWGIPRIDASQNGGLSRDGQLLVLAPIRYAPVARTRFLVLDTHAFGFVGEIDLRGDFAYDALSPSGRYVYLIQHVDPQSSSRYVVRAFDRWRQVLLPGRIADSAQRGWAMQGRATQRITSAGGRFVYTLYGDSGGYPFVHALDTVARQAHCIGLPWVGSAGHATGIRLSLSADGRTLSLSKPRWGGGTALRVDTRTWRVSAPGGGSFEWGLLAAALVAAVLLGAVSVETLRRVSKRRQEEKPLLVPQVPGTGGV